MNFRHLTAAALLCLAPACAQNVTGPIVQFATNVGNINVTLRADVAPNTVANFLSYVNNGLYNNSIIHRSVPGFVIQGGGWQLLSGTPTQITAGSPVNNECPLLSNGVPHCGISNTTGTLAMAKVGGQPNSATDEWFFNVENNSSTLDFQNGGYTVFGQIDTIDTASINVMNQINALPLCDQSGTYFEFGSLPVLGNPLCTAIGSSNYVVVNSITQVQAVPTITPNGIVTASAFGNYVGAAAPGSYVEIYGKYLAGTTRGWATTDFTGIKAPTSLDGVTVTLNGTPAYVNYVSPTQVNIQVPDNIAVGTVQVVVNFQGQTSAPGTLAINATEPGLLAPASFKVGSKQYVAAVHAATNGFVSSGNIPNVPAAPAKSGETLIFYGTGFGPLANSIPVAGQIASGQTSLANSFQMLIGNIPATVLYSGLAPGLVGVYQFNVVVPTGVSNGDVQVVALVNGFFPLQTLYLSVAN
jgi:uncharacterized protein (TIGR03437 family)